MPYLENRLLVATAAAAAAAASVLAALLCVGPQFLVMSQTPSKIRTISGEQDDERKRPSPPIPSPLRFLTSVLPSELRICEVHRAVQSHMSDPAGTLYSFLGIPPQVPAISVRPDWTEGYPSQTQVLHAYVRMARALSSSPLSGSKTRGRGSRQHCPCLDNTDDEGKCMCPRDPATPGDPVDTLGRVIGILLDPEMNAKYRSRSTGANADHDWSIACPDYDHVVDQLRQRGETRIW
ncbi:hypothetical protein MKZ38_006183 [Zalerion maritima]|uniref:Uncharacterized protein n=1 Tax=Zalerion maritima TaxID=339359 RepID=A0AAD5WPW9_9PEZI|nr:hypothetical protein MKZ38_006183 [Zalerion maritima]